jgi:tRNA threonylcarbamoyladenosine modification (KEOPS) complex Cgi121 subunit
LQRIKRIYKLGDKFVSILVCTITQVKDIGKLIDDLRNISNEVSLQVVDVNIVYGVEHILDVLKITLESENRKIMLAKRVETDLILRLLCTDQISLALKHGGIKNDSMACFIVFSKNKMQLLKVRNYIHTLFRQENDSILKSNKVKKKTIAANIGLTSDKIFNDDTFAKYLRERASLITK